MAGLKPVLFSSRLRLPVNDSDRLGNPVGLVLWKQVPLQLLDIVVRSFEISLEYRNTRIFCDCRRSYTGQW